MRERTTATKMDRYLACCRSRGKARKGEKCIEEAAAGKVVEYQSKRKREIETKRIASVDHPFGEISSSRRWKRLRLVAIVRSTLIALSRVESRKKRNSPLPMHKIHIHMDSIDVKGKTRDICCIDELTGQKLKISLDQAASIEKGI